MPIKIDKNMSSARYVEEHMMNGLRKKKETTSVRFENNEDNKDYDKTGSERRKERKSIATNNKKRIENNSVSVGEKVIVVKKGVKNHVFKLQEKVKIIKQSYP